MANFALAYLVLAPRHLKQFYKFDHNASPREDIAKYGEKMVAEGKISSATLRMIKRWESAQANAIENFTLFTASVLLATYAGVPTGTLNGLMASYLLARIGYGIAYITIEKEIYSLTRSLCWWWGNLSCLAMLVLAGKRL